MVTSRQDGEARSIDLIDDLAGTLIDLNDSVSLVDIGVYEIADAFELVELG